MKKLITLVAVAAIFLGVSAQDKDANIYLVKSGHVEYDLTGNITGTKTIWWDDYGAKSYEEEKTTTKIKFLGMVSEQNTHNITVTKDGKFWTANMIEKTGMTGSELVHELRDEFSEMDEKEMEEFGQEMFDALGGKKLPPEKFLGRTCEVMEIMGAKSYIYKNIPLKSTAKIMGIEANTVATLFEENINVPSSKFTPPSGINYEEMPTGYDNY